MNLSRLCKKTVALAFALALIGTFAIGFAKPTRAHAASVYYVSYPSWWNGHDCNSGNNNNASGAAYSTWEGLYACYPLSGGQWTKTQPNIYDPIPHATGSGGLMWQCVDLSKRWMYLEYGLRAIGVTDGSTLASDYYNYYHNSHTMYLITFISGYTYPVIGDVISLKWSNGGAHTAVVTDSSIDGSGNGYISVLQENAYGSGSTPSSYEQWTISNNGTKITNAYGNLTSTSFSYLYFGQ